MFSCPALSVIFKPPPVRLFPSPVRVNSHARMSVNYLISLTWLDRCIHVVLLPGGQPTQPYQPVLCHCVHCRAHIGTLRVGALVQQNWTRGHVPLHPDVPSQPACSAFLIRNPTLDLVLAKDIVYMFSSRFPPWTWPWLKIWCTCSHPDFPLGRGPGTGYCINVFRICRRYHLVSM